MMFRKHFRKGITFEINGEPHMVQNFRCKAEGAAFVRAKYSPYSPDTREDFQPG
ncbi:MAG: hypothetical protein ACLTK0_07675 [Anaerovoracaceae bacterium]